MRRDAAVADFVVAIQRLGSCSSGPLLVALDGRSGSGKSTLAAAVGRGTGALVIDGDDFYRGGSGQYWDALDVRTKLDLVIDWPGQRAVLERLRRFEAATWRPYDWEADDGRRHEEITAAPNDIVILDGAYSARPELTDLYTVRVVLEVSRDVRRERLLRREGLRYRAEWEAAVGRRGGAVLRDGDAAGGVRPRARRGPKDASILGTRPRGDLGRPRRVRTSLLSRHLCSASTAANVSAKVNASPGQRAET